MARSEAVTDQRDQIAVGGPTVHAYSVQRERREAWKEHEADGRRQDSQQRSGHREARRGDDRNKDGRSIAECTHRDAVRQGQTPAVDPVDSPLERENDPERLDLKRCATGRFGGHASDR